MPNLAAKFSSAYINADAMRDFIAELPSVLREIYGECHLTISYGWSCNLHHDLWYKKMTVPLDVFPYFIEDSIDQRIFEICNSDLLIESPDSNVRILLCHESDIHIDGSDDQSIARIRDLFHAIDFRSNEDWKKLYNRESSISGPDTPDQA